jgi:hypothetical protein
MEILKRLPFDIQLHVVATSGHFRIQDRQLIAQIPRYDQRRKMIQDRQKLWTDSSTITRADHYFGPFITITTRIPIKNCATAKVLFVRYRYASFVPRSLNHHRWAECKYCIVLLTDRTESIIYPVWLRAINQNDVAKMTRRHICTLYIIGPILRKYISAYDLYYCDDESYKYCICD